MPNHSTMDASDGNYMVINGMRYPIINSWVDVTSGERKRWSIVTEGGEPVQLTEWERELVQSATQETEEQPFAADATVPLPPGAGGFLRAFRDVTCATTNVNPVDDPITPEEDEDQEEEEGEPIFRMRTGFDDFLFDKYGPSGTRDSGGIPPTGGAPILPPYTPPAP